MSSGDSFVNWGFNPEYTKGSSYNFAISTGWGTEELESGNSLVLYKDLKTALITFRSYLWDVYDYKWDDFWHHIDVDGQRIFAHNTNIVNISGNRNNNEEIILQYGLWKYEGFKGWGVGASYSLENEISKKRISIPNLLQTIPYEVARFGVIGGGNIAEFSKADRVAFEEELDRLPLREYTQDLKRAGEKTVTSVIKPTSYGRPLKILEYQYTDEHYQSITSTLYFLP